MIRLSSVMIIVSTVIISTLNSCSKDAPLTDHNTGGTTMLPMTLTLTTNNWEQKANGIMVNIFSNVLGGVHANYSIKVYLVTDGKDRQINQPISFMNGELWSTNTQTDVVINYRGNQHPSYLNIKVVLDQQ